MICLRCAAETRTDLAVCASCELREALRYYLAAEGTDQVAHARHVVNACILAMDTEAAACIIAEVVYTHLPRRRAA